MIDSIQHDIPLLIASHIDWFDRHIYCRRVSVNLQRYFAKYEYELYLLPRAGPHKPLVLLFDPRPEYIGIKLKISCLSILVQLIYDNPMLARLTAHITPISLRRAAFAAGLYNDSIIEYVAAYDDPTRFWHMASYLYGARHPVIRAECIGPRLLDSMIERDPQFAEILKIIFTGTTTAGISKHTILSPVDFRREDTYMHLMHIAYNRYYCDLRVGIHSCVTLAADRKFSSENIYTLYVMFGYPNILSAAAVNYLTALDIYPAEYDQGAIHLLRPTLIPQYLAHFNIDPSTVIYLRPLREVVDPLNLYRYPHTLAINALATGDIPIISRLYHEHKWTDAEIQNIVNRVPCIGSRMMQWLHCRYPHLYHRPDIRDTADTGTLVPAFARYLSHSPIGALDISDIIAMHEMLGDDRIAILRGVSPAHVHASRVDIPIIGNMIYLVLCGYTKRRPDNDHPLFEIMKSLGLPDDLLSWYCR